MRWVQLGVDYEMYGKDLIDSAKIGQRIVKILVAACPRASLRALFDAEGQKISKSKGNGLSIEEWLTYAPHESLALYNFLPRSAKLHFAVIPKAVDDYLTWRDKYADDPAAKRLENPAWHIHGDAVPPTEAGLNFTLLLNLVAVANSEDAEVLWGFIRNYAPELTAEQAPMLDRLVTYALRTTATLLSRPKPTGKPARPKPKRCEHWRAAWPRCRAMQTQKPSRARSMQPALLQAIRTKP